MTLFVLDDRLAVCRLSPDQAFPEWIHGGGGLVSVTRTADELSVVCREEHVPDDVRCSKGWRALKIEGPFALNEVGILLPIADTLARAGISMLALATFDTDYLLVDDDNLALAVDRLSAAGHTVLGS